VWSAGDAGRSLQDTVHWAVLCGGRSRLGKRVVHASSTKCHPAVIIAQTRLPNERSGVTRNSGAIGQISKSSPPFHFPTSLPLLPSPLTLLPFPSLPTPSRPSLHPRPLPIPSLFFPPHSLPFNRNGHGCLGERYSSLSRCGWSPAAKRVFVQFAVQNLQIC